MRKNIYTLIKPQFLILASIFILFTILPYSIFADNKNSYQNSAPQQSIKISPAIYTPTLSPGKKITYQMSLQNLLSVPLPIYLAVEDFNIEDQTGEFLFEENTNQSVLSWVNITPRELILNPKEKRTVLVEITTPEKIPFGGYFGMIFAEIKFPGSLATSSNLNAKVGSLLIASIGEPQTGARRARLEVPNGFPKILVNNNNISLNFKVKNNSLHHFVARPFIDQRNSLSKSSTFIETALDEKFIFPGKSREWKTDFKHNLKIPGIYRFDLSVSLGNGEQLKNSFYSVYLPWQAILLIFVLIIFTIFFIKKTKRHKRKVKINKLKIS